MNIIQGIIIIGIVQGLTEFLPVSSSAHLVFIQRILGVKSSLAFDSDRITVYKANMIIPQIAENITKSGDIAIPDRCPVCGSFTKFRDDKYHPGRR